VVALRDEYRARIEEAEEADAKLIATVRDKMLGTRPSERNRSLIGIAISEVRSRTSLR
jgi:hypothetical protein